jgi:Bacterial PH domain
VDIAVDEVTFGPDRRLSFVAAPGAVLALAYFLLADDAPQRLFTGVVVVVLLAIVATDLVFAPRLVVSPEGLRVRTPFDRATLPWPELDFVRATTSQRYGLRTVVLEISAGDRLLVLDRRDLAADPEKVADVIERYRLTR